jgi:energy-coupling factor transport system permease protein
MEARFERFHPFVSFLYYFAAIGLFLLMLHPIFLLAGLMVILFINFQHDRLEGLRRWLYLILISIFFMVILNPLFNERGIHVLFTLFNHRFTLEALVNGGMTAVSVIGVILLFVSYNIVMTPNKLLYLFSRFLPQLALLLMLTLRFIPFMKRRLEEISLIQQSKGFSTKQGNWRQKAKTAMLYVQTLVTFSLEEAIQTADSMKARAYGTGTRSTYEYFKFHWSDFLAILYLIMLGLPALIGRFFGYGFFRVYPIMESWHLTPEDLVTFICYLLFLSFPILVEAGGMFRWRILK